MFGDFDTKQTYMIVHYQTQLALQAPLQANYNKNSLQLGPPNQNNSKQLWIVENKGKFRYQLILAYVDKVLTADGEYTTLKQGTGDKGSQYWIIDTSIPNRIKICQAKQNKKFLSVQNHHIVIKKNPPFDLIDCWEFKPIASNIELNRSCFLRCMRTNKVIDVPASKGNEGVQICVWQSNYRFNQRWRIFRAGQVYIIKSFKTDLNLDIAGEQYEDGTKVIQWHSTGGHNQFWRFEKKNLHTYRICSWIEPTIQLGHDGNNLIAHKGHKFTWKVEGFIPEI